VTQDVAPRAAVTRVLVAASSAVVRAGLEALIASLTIQVVGRSSSTALAGPLQDIRPDVVLLELEQHDEDLRTLLALDEGPGAPGAPAFVVLADDPRGAWAADALRAGARAVLPREASAVEIVAAVEGAAAGLVVLHPDVVDALLLVRSSPARVASAPAGQALTPREVEVLGMMAEGLGNKTIARRMGISEHTVKFHVGSIFTKLDASSRTEAVTLGARQGLIML